MFVKEVYIELTYFGGGGEVGERQEYKCDARRHGAEWGPEDLRQDRRRRWRRTRTTSKGAGKTEQNNILTEKYLIDCSTTAKWP